MASLRSLVVPRSGGEGISSPSIRADRLEVRYQNKLVWHDASFDIKPGEFVAVIGPNGAGKTTLFRMLLGIHYPSAGTLSVLGEAPRRGNRRIGYVPQRHTINNDTHLDAASLVGLGLRGTQYGPPGLGLFKWGVRYLSPRESEDAVYEALEAAGATDLADKPLGTCSGGELQRIFLAEALVGRPEMLLLDEPLSNLDLRRSRELVETVHEIVRERKVTTLLVAHDINPMIKCLNKVIYIANGRVATGTPDAVLNTESLTALYGVPVEVLRDSRGNLVIVGGEDEHGEEGG